VKRFYSRRLLIAEGRWEEAIMGMRRALSLDVRNQVILGALPDSDYWLRRYREVEQIFDRLIELAPHKPSLKAYKASVALERIRACAWQYEMLPHRFRGQRHR
jgi:tetratricopeptide (TPR) repeat protein